MRHLVLLLLMGMSASGCASSAAMKELEAKRQAAIEAAKIPPVELSTQQIEKLRELAPAATITWVRAGRRSDGKIFVCHVIEAKDLFGTRRVNLLTGTFEADGSYQRSLVRLLTLQAVLQECNAHGFNPPVTIQVRVY